MNIALSALSSDNRTGIGRIVRSLSREFVAAGHSVTLVVQHAESVPEGVRVLLQWQPPLSNAAAKLMFNFQTKLLFARTGFGVVNGFGVGRGAHIVTAQSCHRAGVEARDRYSRGRLGRGGIGVFDRVSLHDERTLMGSGVHVIAVSELVRRELIRFYDVPAGNIHVIPNGVEGHPVPESAEVRDRARKEAGAGRGDFVLLFIGNEFDRKGLQTVIEATALLCNGRIRVLVVGDDESSPYEARAGTLGVRSQISFAGSTASPERFYAAADAFVLPTYYEPFGMVIIEALAAGVPVITSARAGAVEGLRHGSHGLFLDDPLSPDELAASIRSLMEDRDLSLRLSQAGRTAAVRFSWRQIARETLAVYAGVDGGESTNR